MKIECGECGWVGDSADLASGGADNYGTRGVCPECGADEAELGSVADHQQAERPELAAA